MTRRRHAIVHRGKAVRTTRQLAHRCVLLAGAICDSVDEIAVDAMKTAASPEYWKPIDPSRRLGARSRISPFGA